jgi:hypothetical protein
LLVGLTVHGENVLPQLAEDADRHGATPDVRAGAAVGTDGARHEKGAVVQLCSRVDGTLHGRVCSVEDQPSLDEGSISTGPNPAGIGAAAEQQRQALDDHGLARAGLPGDDGQTGSELQHGVVDDPEPTDPHLLEHAAEPRRHDRH